MRLLLVLSILFAAVVALGFWTNRSLQSVSGELAQNVEHITAQVESNNWERAYEQTIELEKTWDGKTKWWPTILNHQEIDNMEFSLARVKEYVAARNTALARGQLSELEMMIRHIPEIQAVTLKNIF